MRRLFAIALAMALTWAVLLTGVVDAASNPAPACTLKLHAAVDLETESNGAWLVPVSFNGIDAWMILNTSIAFSGMSDAAMTAFSLKRQTIKGISSSRIDGRPLTESGA